MAKGYWLSTGSINDGEGMQPYLKALKEWLPSVYGCLLYTSPSPRDIMRSRMPSSA